MIVACRFMSTFYSVLPASFSCITSLTRKAVHPALWFVSTLRHIPATLQGRADSGRVLPALPVLLRARQRGAGRALPGQRQPPAADSLPVHRRAAMSKCAHNLRLAADMSDHQSAFKNVTALVRHEKFVTHSTQQGMPTAGRLDIGSPDSSLHTAKRLMQLSLEALTLHRWGLARLVIPACS